MAVGAVNEETTTVTVEVTGTSLHVDVGLRTVSVGSDMIFFVRATHCARAAPPNGKVLD